jgi:hypothetical protein
MYFACSMPLGVSLMAAGSEVRSPALASLSACLINQTVGTFIPYNATFNPLAGW